MQGETGPEQAAPCQVISRSEPKPGERIRIIAQSCQSDGRVACAIPNEVPDYLSASPAQRYSGMFAADPVTKLMPRGDPLIRLSDGTSTDRPGGFPPLEYEIGAPAGSHHFGRWFRNVMAAFQGRPGTPRLALGALPRLTAGDEIRTR